jgi:nucleoside-diphosphate-sugar epimerase
MAARVLTADAPPLIASRTIVVTGADGFLGRAVCARLSKSGVTVRALVRTCVPELLAPYQVVYSGLHDVPALRHALQGADAVIHLAARVHHMRDEAADPARAYHHVNVDGTRVVASIAAQLGVRELLMASSVKAMGEANERAWTEVDMPAPVDPYGRSKLEAEQVLAEISAATDLRTGVLSLPLLYGPGMKANMLRLYELVDRGVPLPFGNIDNARSLLYVGNAAAAFSAVLGTLHGHERFFASDGEDVSTPELIRRIATSLGRPARLLPAPRLMLHVLARSNVPFASPAARRLIGSLTVDATRLRVLMGRMPFTLDEGLRATGMWYRDRQSAA